MPHIEGSKSIATLMDEQAKNGIEPTRAEILILTNKKVRLVDYWMRSLAKAVDMMNERLRDTDESNDQSPCSVAWEGDVYSQVLGNDKSGYVRGLVLGPTPSVLWGSRSSLGNIVIEDSSDEVVQKQKHEIIELKELNEKQNDEMSFMRQELSWMRQVMRKIAPNEIHMPQNITV
ncbi:uncharacterized protein [Nicotiana tomentosiformis]